MDWRKIEVSEDKSIYSALIEEDKRIADLEKENKELRSQLELKNNKQAQIMAGSGKVRRKWDRYETPSWAVEAIFKRESFNDGIILEPCCASGNISRVIDRLYPDCGIHSDICLDKIYEGAFPESIDFLNYDIEDLIGIFKYTEQLWRPTKPDFIVTNPPYSLFSEFVLKAKEVCRHKFAFFIKTNGLHGIKRYKEIYSDEEFPLARVYLFDRRVNFDGFTVSNTLESCWIVFCKHHVGPPLLFWIDDGDQPVDKNKKYEMEVEELDLFKEDLI